MSVTVSPIAFRSVGEMQATMKKSLTIFNTYYRRRVQQRFAAEGPGWAPRKVQTSAPRDRQALALATHKMEIKLLRDIRRASARLTKGKGTTASLVRRARVLEEFRRQATGVANAFFSPDERLSKSVHGLRERMGRAEAAASARILGRMPASMKSQVAGAVLTVTNLIPWSGVQNEGGTVGRGAKVPARPFNYFESIDGEVFAEITANMMLAALT